GKDLIEALQPLAEWTARRSLATRRRRADMGSRQARGTPPPLGTADLFSAGGTSMRGTERQARTPRRGRAARTPGEAGRRVHPDRTERTRPNGTCAPRQRAGVSTVTAGRDPYPARITARRRAWPRGPRRTVPLPV